MDRITTLMERIRELNNKPNVDLIDLDLMMDYTKVIYADLFEWRKKIAFNETVTIPAPETPETAEQPVLKQEHNVPAGNTTVSTPAPEQPVVAEEADYPPVALEEKPVIPVEEPSFQYNSPHYSNADLRELISINDKYQFISELFNNNRDAYEEVMQELNTFDTEEEAIIWINNSISNQFNWKDDMDSVQNFFRILSEFYSSR